jgi:solute carrier family 44 protein 1 (choline transporter-like protein)
MEVFNRCWKKDKNNNTEEEVDIGNVFQEIAQDLINLWPQMSLVCLVAFVFSYILLMLFRYAIKYVIWIIYISFIVVFAILAIVLWVLCAMAKEDERIILLVGAIIVTTITLLFALLLYLFRKRIQLVAELFKEASRALIDVPGLMFEPILVSNLIDNRFTLDFNVQFIADFLLAAHFFRSVRVLYNHYSNGRQTYRGQGTGRNISGSL